MNALKRLDKYKDTIIVFVSDNGAKFDKDDQGTFNKTRVA